MQFLLLPVLVAVCISSTLHWQVEGRRLGANTGKMVARDCNNQLCRLDVSQLSLQNTDEIQVTIPGRENSISCTRVNIEQSKSWYGECSSDGGNLNLVQRPSTTTGPPEYYGTLHTTGNLVCRIQNLEDHHEIHCYDLNDRELFADEMDEGDVDETVLDTVHQRDLNTVVNGTYSSPFLQAAPQYNRRGLYDDNGSTIDVMVVWTKQAECLNSERPVGCTPLPFSESSMRGLIDLAVAETNTAFELSGIRTRLRLVHAYRDETYNEPPKSTTAGIVYQSMLTSLQGNGDKKLDQVHEKRELYGADMVFLFAGTTGICGNAVSRMGAANAFHVVNYNCATGKFTFGHELAHSFGARHDREVHDECTLNGYHWGYRDPEGGFRDIMSKRCFGTNCDGTTPLVEDCPRVQRFSNTQFKYNNKTMGVSNRMDVARLINEKASTVASYYPAMNCRKNLDCDDNNAETYDTCNTEMSVCVFTPGSAPTCQQDSDCQGGDQCNNNVCGPAAQCETAADCEDADPGYVLTCQASTCSYRAIPGFCLTNDDCTDSDPSTSDACVNDFCVFTPIEGFCLEDATCNDNRTGTSDTCNIEKKRCVFTQIEGYCEEDGDCADQDPSTSNHCVQNKCEFIAIPGFCLEDADCDDSIPGTTDTCNVEKKRCSFDPIVGYCEADSDCADKDRSTSNHCTDNRCEFIEIPGFCLSNAECNDQDASTMDTCDLEKKRCAFEPIDGFCTENKDCDDDDLSTADSCNNDNKCVNQPIEDFCLNDSSCDDKRASTRDRCVDYRCVFDEIEGFCAKDGDCDDNDVSTMDICETNQCLHLPRPDYCETDIDCDDDEASTLDVCQDHTCRYSIHVGFCTEDTNCNDNNTETLDQCVNSSCVFTLIEGCTIDDDCDDENEATKDSCGIDSVCNHTLAPGYCGSDMDCFDRDPSTTDRCVESLCIFTPIPGYCESDSDCTVQHSSGTCPENSCVFDEGVCFSDSDCNDFDNSTIHSCVEFGCRYQTICQTSDDCDEDSTCQDTVCGVQKVINQTSDETLDQTSGVVAIWHPTRWWSAATGMILCAFL